MPSFGDAKRANFRRLAIRLVWDHADVNPRAKKGNSNYRIRYGAIVHALRSAERHRQESRRRFAALHVFGRGRHGR